MIELGANGRKVAYGIKHFNLDSFDDLKKIKGYVLKPGCTAFVIETSKRYILNSKFKWVEVKNLGGGSSGGSNDGDIDNDEYPDYDGGNIDGSDPNEGDGYPDYDGGSIDGSDPT